MSENGNKVINVIGGIFGLVCPKCGSSNVERTGEEGKPSLIIEFKGCVCRDCGFKWPCVKSIIF